jgi:hypothetical protein
MEKHASLSIYSLCTATAHPSPLSREKHASLSIYSMCTATAPPPPPPSVCRNGAAMSSYVFVIKCKSTNLVRIKTVNHTYLYLLYLIYYIPDRLLVVVEVNPARVQGRTHRICSIVHPLVLAFNPPQVTIRAEWEEKVNDIRFYCIIYCIILMQERTYYTQDRTHMKLYWVDFTLVLMAVSGTTIFFHSVEVNHV